MMPTKQRAPIEILIGGKYSNGSLDVKARVRRELNSWLLAPDSWLLTPVSRATAVAPLIRPLLTSA